LRGGRHADEAVGRNRLLERLLLGAIQMSSLRIVTELQQRIAETVQEVFGFRRVVLHVYAPSAVAFEARAFAGLDGDETAALASNPTSRDQYLAWTNARYRVSNSSGRRRCRIPDDVLDATRDRRRPGGRPVAGATHLRRDSRLPGGRIAHAGERPGAYPPRIPRAVSTTALASAEAHDRLARNNAEIPRPLRSSRVSADEEQL
jgi:hypothetical protein